MLHLAVEKWQWNIAEMLVNKSADLNVHNAKGQTALMIEVDRWCANENIYM